MRRASLLIIAIFAMLPAAPSSGSTAVLQRTSDADSVTVRMERQLAAWPQEKLYVQTDKAAYLSGERIWLRTHVADAATLRPLSRSRYVYLELLNPFSEIVERIMLRPDSLGVFAGHLDLAEELPEGSYTIRAYTRYMENRGPDCFFRKSVGVLDPYSVQLAPEFSFSSAGGKTALMRLRFAGGRTPDFVGIRLPGKGESRLRQSEGEYVFRVPEGARTLLLGVRDGKRRYQRYVSVPSLPGEYDVAFLPEGGYLIAGRACRVGVKALASDGLGTDISGVVLDSKGEQVAAFGALHRGMGSFLLRAEEGESYTAVCTSSDGSKRSFALPQASSSARILQLFRSGKNLFVNLAQGVDAPQETLSLLIHRGGQPIYHEAWEEGRASYSLPLASLPSGVLGFCLLNGSNDILSERLYFNVKESDILANIGNEIPPIPGPREAVRLELQFPLSAAGALVAVAVTDAETALPEKARSLASELLLCSELRGNIEAPAEYFSPDAKAFDLDALMLTQGWRRYDLPAVLKGDITLPATPPERSQKVSGRAEAYIFNSMDGGGVALYATKDSLSSVNSAPLARDGRFSFDVEFPEGTAITVQTRTRKGGKGNVIKLDESIWPSPAGAAIPVRGGTEVPVNYISQADEAYLLEHGMRATMLDAAFVSAEREEKPTDSKWYSPVTSSEPLTAREISDRHFTDILAVFMSTPGLTIRRNAGGSYLSTTRSELPVLPVIDDVVLTEYDLFSMTPGDIDNLFVIKDLTSMFGYYPGYSGALVIKTTSGPDGRVVKSDNISRVTPLGYQLPAEFYTPAYGMPDAPALPDLRTTIFWAPEVKISPSGTAVIEFSTADPIVPYNLTAEGLTPYGRIVHATLQLLRREE